MTGSVYQSRPIKRQRRTQADMQILRNGIYNLLAAEYPMTCRQVYYRLVSDGSIQKTEAQYDAVVRLLGLMRREGAIPFQWLADSTRWMRKPSTHNSMEDALAAAAHFYRRDLWTDQDSYVEIWLEKEALAGVLVEVTDSWHVPLMVTRGYPSLSFLHSASETIADAGKRAFIYYLGDLDPSGIDISRTVESGLREFAPHTDISFQRIAVTQDQVIQFNLQTRPTKKSDPRSEKFQGESVEVDAIPPAILRSMVEQYILLHLDPEKVDQCRRIESAERATLAHIAEKFS